MSSVAFPLPTCPVTWPNNYDLETINTYIKELYLQFPLFDYYSFNIIPANVDPLYLEDLNKSFTKYQTRIFLEVNPSDKSLSRFGIDERREVIAWFPTQVLLEMNLNVKKGDVLVLNYPSTGPRIEYVGLETHETEWWGNTGFPLYTTLAMNRRYLSIRRDERVENTDNVPKQDDFYDKHVITEQDTDNFYK